MNSEVSIFTRLRKRAQYEIAQLLNHSIDKIAGIRTEYCKVPASTRSTSEIVSQAKRYQPSSYRLVYRSLKWCHKRFPQHTVLDLGCGAGRVLVVAAIVGYHDVFGLEFDEALSNEAAKNIKRFGKRFGLRRNISVITESATDFELRNLNYLVYLYNPFGNRILNAFLEKNLDVLQQHDCIFVYINPIHETCIHSLGYKTIHCWDVSDFSRTTRVYRHEKYC